MSQTPPSPFERIAVGDSWSLTYIFEEEGAFDVVTLNGEAIRDEDFIRVVPDWFETISCKATLAEYYPEWYWPKVAMYDYGYPRWRVSSGGIPYRRPRFT